MIKETSQQLVSSFLIITGSVFALWWLYKNTSCKKGKNAKNANSYETQPPIKLDRNRPILESLLKLAENEAIYKVETSVGVVTVVNSKDLIKLVGFAKDVGMLKNGFNLVTALKEIHREEECGNAAKICEKKIREECSKTIAAFNCEDRNISKNVLVEVDKLVEVLRCEEHSNKVFCPQRYITLACTNVISLMILGCRFKYKSKRLKRLIEMIETHLGYYNLFGVLKVGEGCDMLSVDSIESEECVPSDNLKKIKSSMKSNLKRFVDFISTEVEKHKETYDENKYRDPIDIYLKSLSLGKPDEVLSRSGLDFTITEFFMKGSRQLGSHLLWAIYCLAKNPNVQNKCHNEIDKKVGQYRQVNLDDFKCLTYVRATLKEVSRLCTVEPLSQPFTSQKCYNLGPYNIHKNSIIVCNFHAVHMNRLLWSSPNDFCPERFLCNCKKDCCLQLFDYGFLDGNSKCPAASMSTKSVFLILTNLLQKFEFEMVKIPHCHTHPPQSSYNFLHFPPLFKVKVDVH